MKEEAQIGGVGGCQLSLCVRAGPALWSVLPFFPFHSSKLHLLTTLHPTPSSKPHDFFVFTVLSILRWLVDGN